MSLKRSHSSGKTFGGGGADTGGKIDRQELFDELKRMAGTGDTFTPVDVALAIGAGEPAVSKALLGLAAEGYLDKVEVGRYRAVPMVDMNQAEFIKAYARASKVDSTRQRDLSEIARLKQNNDTMRQRLLAAIAERDHYLAALRRHGVDPGPLPEAPAAAAEAPPAPALAAAVVAAAVAPPAPAGESAAPAAVPASEAETAPLAIDDLEAAAAASAVAAPAEPERDVDEAPPGPAGLDVPSAESDRVPSGPGDSGASHS